GVVVAASGAASPLGPPPDLVRCPIGPGTANIAAGPAMTREQAVQAIESGARLAGEALDAGADLLATGEMGIGNTTTASVIAAAITGQTPERVTGRGTGVDAATLVRKVAVVRQALAVNDPDARDGLDVLAKVGGFEIGGLAGVILAGAARGGPFRSLPREQGCAGKTGARTAPMTRRVAVVVAVATAIAVWFLVVSAPAVAFTTRDMLGREVTLAAPPARIVSLVPSITEILYALNAEDMLVGVTDFCDFPAEARQ